MLGRLDDKLDELQGDDLNVKHHNNTIFQRQTVNSTSLTPLMDQLEHNTLCRSHSTHNSQTIVNDSQHTQQRIPLSSLINELVSTWSRGFIQLAEEGDTSSMTLVAQMYLHKRGWGCISYDREKGIEWLMAAIDGGDIEARSTLQRIDKERYRVYMEKKLGRKMNEDDEEKDRKLIENQRNEIENIHGT